MDKNNSEIVKQVTNFFSLFPRTKTSDNFDNLSSVSVNKCKHPKRSIEVFRGQKSKVYKQIENNQIQKMQP